MYQSFNIFFLIKGVIIIGDNYKEWLIKSIILFSYNINLEQLILKLHLIFDELTQLKCLSHLKEKIFLKLPVILKKILTGKLFI